MTYFCPALDPPLDGSGGKTTTLVRDLEYFIHTKFHQNPSTGSREEVENVNSLTDDGRQTDGRTTDAGQRMITIGHWSLWLLCPKNVIKKKNIDNIFMVHILSFITDMYWKINGCKDYTIRSVEIGRSLQPWSTMVYKINKSRDLKKKTGNHIWKKSFWIYDNDRKENALIRICTSYFLQKYYEFLPSLWTRLLYKIW